MRSKKLADIHQQKHSILWLPGLRIFMNLRPYVCPTLWSSDLMIVWPYDRLTLWLSDTISLHETLWSSDLMIVWPYDRLTLWSSDLMFVWTYDLTLCLSGETGELMIWPYVCPGNLMIVHVDDRLVDDCLLTPPRGWFLPDRLWSNMDHACAIFLESPCHKDPKNDAPSPWVCYSVVWYCMLGHGMVWVLSIDGCSLQMGAKHPSAENTHL